VLQWLNLNLACDVQAKENCGSARWSVFMRIDSNNLGNLGPSQAGRSSETPAIVAPDKNGSGVGKTGTGADRVELSGFTGRVSESLQSDAASRAQRVSQLTAAVRSGTYKVDSLAVSRALIDQAIAPSGSGGTT
jgi:flagellar biosynthesis anti-sigma factor FlgM